MACPKCSGLLELNKWVLEEWGPGQHYEEYYYRCVNCGKRISEGIYCNQMFPPEVKERSGREIAIIGDPTDWGELDL